MKGVKLKKYTITAIIGLIILIFSFFGKNSIDSILNYNENMYNSTEFKLIVNSQGNIPESITIYEKGKEEEYEEKVIDRINLVKNISKLKTVSGVVDHDKFNKDIDATINVVPYNDKRANSKRNNRYEGIIKVNFDYNFICIEDIIDNILGNDEISRQYYIMDISTRSLVEKIINDAASYDS